jgi:hypothetical protein
MSDNTLVVHMHNGFSAQVHGNPEGIDVIAMLLIPNTSVKAIALYGGEPLAKIKTLNYTQLKAARSQGGTA